MHSKILKVLFIGSFLSKKKGTKSVAEKISILLREDQIDIQLKSHFQNKFLRLFDILFSILFSKAKTINFDVFSGQAFQITKLGIPFAKFRKKHIILTLRGGALVEFAEKHGDLVIQTLAKGNRIQTPSLFLKDYFDKKGLIVHYLPNPLELKNFPYNREHVNKHSLLWVRAFTEIYNPHLPVETLFELRKTFPDSTLTMIGPDKGLLQETKELIEKLGLQNCINITGPVKNEALFSYYQSHSVYLNTTSYESFGVAVFEAASCGIPIVSGKVGEIPFLWKHGENMLFAEELIPSYFTEQVCKLFESSELSKLLSINARQKSEEYAWEKIKPFWLNVLRQNNEHP